MKRIVIVIVLISGLVMSCRTVDKTTDIDYLAIEEAAWKTIDSLEARIIPPVFPNRIYLITDYGAKGDGKTDNREFLLRAIKECSSNGGGSVVIPPGDFYCDGPLHLESNVNMHLKEGSELNFSDKPDSYLPLVKVRWEGTVVWNYSPQIYAIGKENIGITGKGVIDGNSMQWSKDWRKLQKPDKAVLRQMGNDKVPDNQRVFGNGFLDLDKDGKDDGHGDGKQHYLRPTLLELYECKNVLIDGPTFRNSPFWTTHFPFTNNITIRNITVRGGYLNDDGIDPDSSTDVLIENCDIHTHDDAIAIKAGRDQDAWDRPKSRNIIIRNCKLRSKTNAFCVGSEMSGGVENLFIENCELYPVQHAINFKCNLDRGGEVKDVFVRNMTIDSLEKAMFIFRMDYHGYRGNNYPTKFKNFYVSDMKCNYVKENAFKIVGVPDQKISNVFLRNITVDNAGTPALIEHAENIIMDNVRVNGELLQSDLK